MNVLTKLKIKIVLGLLLLVAIGAVAYHLFGGIGGAVATIGGVVYAGFKHLVGRAGRRSDNGTGEDTLGVGAPTPDQVAEKLQGQNADLRAINSIVAESLERSAVELDASKRDGEVAGKSASDASRQLDLALDILEGSGKGSPDRLH